MDQSEVNRFNTNKIQAEPALQINNELNANKIIPQTQENENKPKQKLVLQDSDQTVYPQQKYKLEKPSKDLISEKYGKPITTINIQGNVAAYNSYIINQVTPEQYETMKFGFTAIPIICPFCQKNIITRIEETFNCCTCFLYIFIILLIPILLILAVYSGCRNVHCNNGCDCTCACCVGGTCDCKCCFDTDHYCSYCGKKIGSRNSCIELCPCFSCCC